MAEHAFLPAPGAKRGRKPATFWPSFTTAEEPYKLRAAVCRHCLELVRHHKKSEQARSHLMKCDAFLKKMATLGAHEQPDWYHAELQKRQKMAGDRAAVGLADVVVGGVATAAGAIANAGLARNAHAVFPTLTTSGPGSPFEPGHKHTKSAESLTSALAAVAGVKKDAGAAKLTKKDIKRVEDSLAMHLFTTMPDDSLTGNPWSEHGFLAQAVVASNRGFYLALPDEKRLMSVLLDRCYAAFKRRVNKFLSTLPVPLALSLDESPSSSPDELVMNYIAASGGGKTVFLESVQFPNALEIGAAEWTANDVTRVIAGTAGTVAGCVTASVSPESRRAWEILELQHPSMFFHGCVRRALEQLLCDLFAPSELPLSALSFELQRFAIECHDLSAFLSVDMETSIGGGDGFERAALHIFDNSKSRMLSGVTFQPSPTRLLSVHQAVIAILRAESFLNTAMISESLFGRAQPGASVIGATPATTTRTPMQTELLEHVTGAAFIKQLQKALQVVLPIARFAARFGGMFHSQPISEVYSGFRQLSTHFAECSELDESEKLLIQMLMQKQYDTVIRRAHLLAYLLDPVHAGQEFPAEMKAEIEKVLIALPNADGSPRDDESKEALYLQYTDFQISAMHLRNGSGDPFVFRMLKERKKSPLQFWLTDGSKWPALQSVACKVFAMPACAADSAQVLQRPGFSLRKLRARLDSHATEKLVYLRTNTRELGVPAAGAAGSSATTAAASVVAAKLFEDSADAADALVFGAAGEL